MCRYLFAIVIAILLAITVAGAIVVEYFGWRGFLVYALCLCLSLWLLKKSLPRLIFRMLTRPLRKMGAVLRAYRITVHSIIPSEPPEDFDEENEQGDEMKPVEDDDSETYDSDDEMDNDDDAEEAERPVGKLEWYRIDITLSPPDGEPEVGRIVVRPPWSVSLLGFTRPKGEGPTMPAGISGLRIVDDVFVSTFEAWDGAEFVEIDEEVHGEQRVCARVGVGPDVRTIVLTYAHITEIGEIQLPRIDVKPESQQ